MCMTIIAERELLSLSLQPQVTGCPEAPCPSPSFQRSACGLHSGLVGLPKGSSGAMMVGLELMMLKGDRVEQGLTKGEYMLLHQRCAVCHWPAKRWGRRLELHHIVGGAGRKDLPDGANWLCLCGRCHTAVHDRIPKYGELPRGAILAAKAEEDGAVDVAKLAALKHRKALPYDQCPIPDQFLADRQRNGGDPWP
jgi:hypothetical protein